MTLQTDSLSKPMDRIIAIIQEFQVAREFIRALGHEPPPAPCLAAEIQRQKFTYRKNQKRRISGITGTALPVPITPRSNAEIPASYPEPSPEELNVYLPDTARNLRIEQIPASLTKAEAEQARQLLPFVEDEKIKALLIVRLQEFENQELAGMAGKALF